MHMHAQEVRNAPAAHPFPGYHPHPPGGAQRATLHAAARRTRPNSELGLVYTAPTLNPNPDPDPDPNPNPNPNPNPKP